MKRIGCCQKNKNASDLYQIMIIFFVMRFQNFSCDISISNMYYMGTCKSECFENRLYLFTFLDKQHCCWLKIWFLPVEILLLCFKSCLLQVCCWWKRVKWNGFHHNPKSLMLRKCLLFTSKSRSIFNVYPFIKRDCPYFFQDV